MSTDAPAPESTQRVAIVGAGITGLSAALRLTALRDDVHVDIFEASDRAGGAIFTEKRDGFLIEHGPDSFITNKPGGLRLCDDLGVSDQLIGTEEQRRRSLVVFRGRPVPIPDGFMLMAPSSPMAILRTPILSWRGKLRLLSEYFRRRRDTVGDESLASFVRRRFGAETLDRLVQPLVGGIYTSDPERLSLQATMPRFPAMEREYGSVIRATLKTARVDGGTDPDTSGSGARYGLFATPADGLSSLISTLQQRLEESGRVTFHFRAAVNGVTSNAGRSKRWSLTGDGPVESAGALDQVLLTTPAWKAAELLQGCRDQQLPNRLAEIEYASSAIVITTHQLSDFSDPLDAFGLVVPAGENRQILAVSYSSRKFVGRAPEGHVLLRTFVGGSMQPELFERSDDEMLEIVRRELSELLGMRKDPAFSCVARYARAMPQYHVGHLDLAREIEQRVAALDGLELAGNACHGVGIPDSISSGYAAAERMADFASR